jgi:hypothetical protein
MYHHTTQHYKTPILKKSRLTPYRKKNKAGLLMNNELEWVQNKAVVG